MAGGLPDFLELQAIRPYPGSRSGMRSDDDVRVVGRHERFKGGGVVRGSEQQRMTGDEGPQVGHQGFDAVVRCKHSKPAPGAEPDSKIIHTLSQLTVRQDSAAGQQGRPFTMAGKVLGKTDPGQFKRESHCATVEDRHTGLQLE